MELESFHGLRREAHGAAALLHLRLTERETPAVLGVRERLRHSDNRAAEINLVPIQPEQLSASHAGCGRRARRGLQGGLQLPWPYSSFVLRAFRLDRTASCLWQVLDRFVFGACGPTLCFSKKPDHSEERPDGAGDKDEQISYRDAQSSDAQRDASFRIALRASSYTQHTRLL